MIRDLTKLATHLDSKGYIDEADRLDNIILKIAEDPSVMGTGLEGMSTEELQEFFQKIKPEGTTSYGTPAAAPVRLPSETQAIQELNLAVAGQGGGGTGMQVTTRGEGLNIRGWKPKIKRTLNKVVENFEKDYEYKIDVDYSLNRRGARLRDFDVTWTIDLDPDWEIEKTPSGPGPGMPPSTRTVPERPTM